MSHRYFSPPTYTDSSYVHGDPLWRFAARQVGQTLLKKDGFYSLHKEVTSTEVADADIAYLGGHVYVVDEAEQADLTTAGYGPQIGDVVDGYGLQDYGAGAYGTQD